MKTPRCATNMGLPFPKKDEPSEEKMRLSNLGWILAYIKTQWKIGAIGSISVILLSLLSLITPYLTKIVVDEAIIGKNSRLLNFVILTLIGIQILIFGASWVTNYAFNRFSLEVMIRIKKDVFHRILRLPMSFFAQNQTGYIMSRISEAEGLNLFFSSTIINIIMTIVRICFCLGILIHLNAKLTIIAILFMPIIFWANKWFSKDVRRLSGQYYEKSAVLSRDLQDSLSGIEIVKLYSAEKRETEKIHSQLIGLKDINIRRTVLISLYSESLSFISAGVGFFILWFSGRSIISGQFTVGSYLAFSAYFAQLFGPVQMIANLGLVFQPAKIALHRIRELLFINGEEVSRKINTKLCLKGKIEVRDIDFEYEADKPIFSKANMVIEAGEKVLIAGPNGSGKSTLIKLIMGFYSPQRGEILFDGQPMHTMSLFNLRERISIVSQNTFLFSDTVRNNILYSAPDSTDEELAVAIRQSGLMEFIPKMVKGINTEIGERGFRLSGGERQKLSIARAILRKSDIIIFDEATTHLDRSSITLIRDIITNRFADKTCIVISHRPIEMPPANRVFWIEHTIIQEARNPVAFA